MAQAKKGRSSKSTGSARKKATTASRKKASGGKSAQAKAKSAPKSKHFAQAKVRAEKVLKDPEAARKLVAAADKKSGAARGGKIAEMRDHIAALLRLIRAYAKGDYRAISWESLVLIVAGLIYFVSPLDLIPDFLPVGLIDDAAVLAFVISVVAQELVDFEEWEKAQPSG